MTNETIFVENFTYTLLIANKNLHLSYSKAKMSLLYLLIISKAQYFVFLGPPSKQFKI